MAMNRKCNLELQLKQPSVLAWLEKDVIDCTCSCISRRTQQNQCELKCAEEGNWTVLREQSSFSPARSCELSALGFVGECPFLTMGAVPLQGKCCAALRRRACYV